MRKFIYGIGIAILSLAAMRSQAADHEVRVGPNSIQFDPTLVTINVGDTVTFVSSSPCLHTGHASDVALRGAAGCDNAGQGGGGAPRAGPWRATVRFDHAGTV